VPVLGLFTKQDGAWRIDPARLAVLVELVRQVPRRAVLYISANHFVDAGVKLAAELAADPRNVMWTRTGPMKPGSYFIVGTTAWTLADLDAPVTRLREEGFRALLSAICALPDDARARIAGVNVLGEVHQLFTGFPDRMGYDSWPDTTDYSPAALAGFRAFLAGKFPDIAALNAATGFAFKSFAEVEAPSHDLHHEALHGFQQQLDQNAAGTLTLQGWALSADAAKLTVSAWLDGKRIAAAPVWDNRLDVTDANPDLPSPNVGWQIHLDYTAIPFGIHLLDLLVEAPGHAPVLFAERHVVVDDRARDTPPPYAGHGVQAAPVSAWPGLRATLDSPDDWTSLFYNPLARLWQAWRQEQVRAYIAHFAGLVNSSCLGPGLSFSHQISPRLNSSWNADLLAVATSEQPQQAYLPGTTLYGGAAFGDAFFAMARGLGWNSYAVTEMHPVFNLGVADMAAMLERHRLAGARYVEPYYMSVQPKRTQHDDNTLTHRRIFAGNPVQGAGAFYAAIEDLVRNH